MVKMWWLNVLLTGCVVLATNPEDLQKEREWLTWAEILGGQPPQQRDSAPLESQASNGISDSNKSNDQKENYDYSFDYDYVQSEDYDESFFDNPDYIYIDTEDENYVPPQVEEEASDSPKSADRRTLDFFYHLFNDQFRTDHDGRHSKDSAKPRRPSLIEEVFRTIDNHIVEDLREWSTYTAQQDAQVANVEPASNYGTPASGIGIPSSIEPIATDNSIVLVTDEHGNQHVVTVDDIVSSLSHLDERTLTNLLLPASADDRSSEVQYTPSLVTAETQSVPVVLNTQQVGQAGVPVVLGTQKIGQVGALRPARHTGPTTTPKEVETEEEVYVVQDENGEVQLVTLDNIIASLALLDEDSLSSLLFEDSAIPSIVPPTSLNSLSPGVIKEPITPSTVTKPDPKPSSVPAAVSTSDKTSEETEEQNKPKPSVSTDFSGNLRVLAHPGSVTVDLKDLSWKTGDEGSTEVEVEEEDKEEEEDPEIPTPVFIGGSLVETDNKGDIYITPDPDKPFTLDIQNIIALAEQAEAPTRPIKVQPSKNENTQSEEDAESEEEPNRGHEILSYLAGVEDFLPSAILPGPIRSNIANSGATAQNFQDPNGVNAFRASLLQALSQQRAAPQPVTTTQRPVLQPFIQRLVQPVVQPIVQPIVQAVTQPISQPSSSAGIGATFSRLITNLVGQSAPQQVETVPQTEEAVNDQEFIKLVVRQQAPNSLDTYFGDVTIPLPQPIHFQPTARPLQVAETTEAEISPRVDIPSPLSRLSPTIQRSLRLQANNVPVFIPPGARASAAARQPATNTVTSRSDSGSVILSDNKVVDVSNYRPAVKPIAKPLPVLRLDARKPLPSIAPVARRPLPSIAPAARRPLPSIAPATRKPLPSIAPAARKPLPSIVPAARKPLPPTAPVTRLTLPPVVTEKPAPSLKSVLNALPPKVLESLRKQVRNAQIGFSQEDKTEHKETETEKEPETPVAVLDRSSYATLPEYPSGGGGYGYGPETGYEKDPWFDIYLLADLTKVHKIGDSNLSVKSPIIGDPAYFVKTRHHRYYR